MPSDLPNSSDKPEQAATNEPPTDETQPSPNPPKNSLYQRYMDAKTGRNVQISDEDMVKYTGMTKAELQEWSKDRPGVAGNQAAGKLAMGQATGFGGYETSQGYGGWGSDAEGNMKFPPKARGGEGEKDVDEEEDAEA